MTKYRVILALAILFAVVRVPLHFAGLAGWLPMGEEAWQGEDLYINWRVGARVRAREDLYHVGRMEILEVYHYSPLYALLYAPLSRLPFQWIAIGHSVLTCVAYVGLYLLWRRIFARWEWPWACQMLDALLPLWLIYNGFYGDLTFLNIYVMLSLLTSLLIYAVIEERLVLAVVTAFCILQAKPHWAFPLALPLLRGRDRFFWRLLISTVGAYIAALLLTSGALGWRYGLAQYRDYANFLLRMTGNFRWRGSDMSLGYNHSLMQIGYHYFGIRPAVRVVVTLLKVLLLSPLLWVAWRMRSLQTAGKPAGRRLSLTAVWALYLGAFLWLDVLWEITLGLVVYVYLRALWGAKPWTWLIRVPFLLYAFQDVWLVATYLVIGEGLTADYFWLDPATHIPLIMIALLALYGGVLWQLWQRLRPGAFPAAAARLEELG